ncbi:MAG: chloride channel protein [Terracidiphilus sp.]
MRFPRTGCVRRGAIGTIAHGLLPGYTATPGAYALVSMGALFAGMVRTPMTSVLMIFEMTPDYAIIVPLMIANLTTERIFTNSKAS